MKFARVPRQFARPLSLPGRSGREGAGREGNENDSLALEFFAAWIGSRAGESLRVMVYNAAFLVPAFWMLVSFSAGPPDRVPLEDERIAKVKMQELAGFAKAEVSDGLS